MGPDIFAIGIFITLLGFIALFTILRFEPENKNKLLISFGIIWVLFGMVITFIGLAKI